tara:strand:+ start:5365 stop:7500 length:2136 start_codon:yes stop_codon:yes gene_type:complete
MELSKHLFSTFFIILLFNSCTSPPLSKEVAELSKKYNTTIYRDSWGVPHIYGKTDTDVAFGLAYAHAQDDIKNIELSVMAARGKMAKYHGKEGIGLDFLVKLFRLVETVEEKYYEDLSMSVRKVCEAYSEGINYYASLYPNNVTLDLYPINGKDIVAGFSLKSTFFFGLDNVVKRLMSSNKRENFVLNDQEIILADLFGGAPIGSNGFAISSKKTADSSTFFMSNSHQPWNGPLSWYEAHVHSEQGWEVSGALFPGMPVFGVGHDKNKAWTHTVNNPDLIDVYELEINPNNKYQYKFDGRWIDLEKFIIPIQVKLWGDLKWTFKREGLWSFHGPVLRRPFGTFAIRYSNLEDIRTIDQWYKINKAKNLDMFLEAMEMTAIPSLNTIYADRESNIFYIYNGRFPERNEEFNWEQLIPGDTSVVVWDSFLPFSSLPQVLNPEAGFVQNCNHTPFMSTGNGENPDSTSFSHTMGIETHNTNRSLRAQEIFSKDSSITFDEFLAAKYDLYYSENSHQVQMKNKIVEEVETSDPMLRDAINLIASWDNRMNIENKQAAIVIITLYELREYFIKGRDFPDKKIMKNAVKNAADYLMKFYGELEVELGQVQRLIRGEKSYPLSGGPDILRAIYSESNSNGKFVGKAGDSYILAVKWDMNGEMQSFSGQPFGTSTNDITSSHYNDQSELFSNHQLKPVWFNLDDIKANLEQVYEPGKEK